MDKMIIINTIQKKFPVEWAKASVSDTASQLPFCVFRLKDRLRRRMILSGDVSSHLKETWNGRHIDVMNRVIRITIYRPHACGNSIEKNPGAFILKSALSRRSWNASIPKLFWIWSPGISLSASKE